MPTLVRDGRAIHFTRDGDGPGVVLVPGLGSGALSFGTLPRRFARAGHTCAAVDPVGLPPSGPLPASGYDFEAAARDVLAVAATLPQPVALVGTSLGGKVALTASGIANGEVDRLVLLCSSAVPTARSTRIYRWFELLCTEVDPALFGNLVAPFLFGATFQQERTALVDDIVRGTRPTDASRAFMRSQALALQRWNGVELARACTLPVLCLAGAEDTLTPPADVAATAALLPRAEFAVVERAGHSLLLETAAAFPRLLTFLSAAG